MSLGGVDDSLPVDRTSCERGSGHVDLVWSLVIPTCLGLHSDCRQPEQAAGRPENRAGVGLGPQYLADLWRHGSWPSMRGLGFCDKWKIRGFGGERLQP